ncbi:c-type cytochrome [Pigmentiphaga sp.]|uniref:c-type cytochrome n=1 Tax=Pigmentiphaga sp. TaxID=1977564 RepID=UPI00128E2138|nr:c-type cytochrome [Pigmentiphaga sp.]MPS29148.1 c-type cytochrome [Alcaligenaceae bacterium SAGV5]MPS54701.1 c-type cytochrome [Alcaligenaceae bacterium SAGV3]MPT59813.1 c-type cytochrome [Alcaligenaceae bacterium]
MDARNTLIAAAIGFCALLVPAASQAGYENLGRHLSKEELAGWDIDVSVDGKGLPRGKGTVVQGEKVYQAMCVACHGVKLEGGLGPALAGGVGSLTTDKPLKTIGSYWPYATTLFDYIRRAMPFQAPQSMSSDDVYSVTAYLLHKNGILPATATVDANSLAKVKMPNRDNFYVDDRPDVKGVRCMKDCLSKK